MNSESSDSEPDVIKKAAHVVPSARQMTWQELEHICFICLLILLSTVIRKEGRKIMLFSSRSNSTSGNGLVLPKIDTFNKKRKDRKLIRLLCLNFLIAFLFLFSLNIRGQEGHRSVQVELAARQNNLLKSSLPGVGCWFWVGQEFKPDGFKPFIDLYAEHTNFRLLTTSIRHSRWVDDPAVHIQVKAAATYARSRGMGIVFDLDIRHARESFRARYPGEQQELVRMRETELDEAGTVSLMVEGLKLGDHYTFGPSPDYDTFASRLLRVYSYAAQGSDIRDITGRCRVERADGESLLVVIPCNSEDRGRKAVVMAAFTLYTPDVFSPFLPIYEKGLLELYADVPLAGACKDEWGFPGRFEPPATDLWYSENMAIAYSQLRPGRDLTRDMVAMFLGDYVEQSDRAAAINHYMQMAWQQCAKTENLFYDAVKEIFGDTAMVMTHPTWVPFPNTSEIFKNGLDWWAVKRDLAQTDESTPYCVRTALTKKWNSPLWLNMFYHSSLSEYKSELWQSLLGGGRLNYHQLFPYDDWLTDPGWNEALLKDSLMQAEARIQLLNYISTRPIDCPVAVIFGHAAAMNWSEPHFGDVGLQITDKLWEAGWYADLIPSSEIASGSLKVGEDGSIWYGPQRYLAAVLYNPEYENHATADFFHKAAAGGRTRLFRTGRWSRDFTGVPYDGEAALPKSMRKMDGSQVAYAVIDYMKSQNKRPYTPCAPNNAYYGSGMVPGASGHMRLLDGTVVYASAKNSVMGDPIQKTFTVDGVEVSFDCTGIAAVRLDGQGRLEALAAGGLASFQGGGVSIKMPQRADVALWKDRNGEWQGVLHGYDGPLPENLETLCDRWTRLRIPVPVTD